MRKSSASSLNVLYFIFYNILRMKKVFLLSSLMATSLLLAACGNSTKELSFQEAMDIANKNSNLIMDLILSEKTPSQQDITLVTTIDDGAGTLINVDITAQSQQDKPAQKSKMGIDFDIGIGGIEGEIRDLTTSGSLTALLTSETVFLNVEKL